MHLSIASLEGRLLTLHVGGLTSPLRISPKERAPWSHDKVRRREATFILKDECARRPW